jgi:hypothetical protein
MYVEPERRFTEEMGYEERLKYVAAVE